MEVTEGRLLGGRIRYAQPAHGFRSGIEPVLLAASVPARPGQRVIEGGTGAGAALLCLAARVPGLSGLGVEIDPALAALAARNLAGNGHAAIAVVAADIAALPAASPFDHAFANPPYHDPAGTPSPDPARARAKRAPEGLVAAWVRALAATLRHRGTLTLILPAAQLPAALAALTDARCGSPAVLPLWPAEGRPARLLLLRGVKGGAGPCRVLPGLVLHAPGGGYTRAAEAVLRDGAALALDDPAAR